MEKRNSDGLRAILFIMRLTVLAILVALPLAANAQITTAALVGTVEDANGAPIANASVLARSTDTGLTRTVTTGEDGGYRIEFLPIGNYVIEVSAASGFKKSIQSNIVLQVNDVKRVDVTLVIGGVNEEVTVTTEPPIVNTTSAELGRTVQSTEITNLPLVERNVYTLLDLTPGVQSNNGGVGSIATASAATSNLSLGFPEQRTLINGGTDGGTGSVNYYLDGGINMTNLRNTGNILPSPDAIQEFRVQTNAYNAEYGRFASGIINVLTKSGTNQLHGSLYEFVRNDKFNSNEWGAVVPRAPYHRNQFGGTVGGPFAKDRSFFFFSYAGLRQITPVFLNGARVPTALERIGDFTQSATKPTYYVTNAPFTCLGVQNVICPAQQDPVAMKIVKDYIPLPNVVLPNGNPGWQGSISSPYNNNEYLIKIDHQLTNAHRLTGTYFNTAGTTTVFPGSGNLPWATQNYSWQQHNVNISDIWVISPNRINQVWLSYTRQYGGRLNVPATSLRDLGSAFTPQGEPSLPQISVSGYFTLSNAIGGPTAGTDMYAIRDLYSWNTGRHSLKFGGEISLNKDTQQTLLNNYGVFTFNGNSTARRAIAPVTAAAGNAFADFLIGIPSAVTQDAPVTGYTNTWYSALFLQDDYRLTQNINLNLGVRWDVQTAPTDPLNRVVNYVPGVKSTAVPAAPIGALFYGDPGVERGGIPTDYSHISPRFGVAWDPTKNGKTSIRFGMGMFYGSISGNEWNTMTNFQPFSTRLTFTNINQTMNAQGQANGATLINPYNNYVGGNPFPYNGTFTNGGGLFAVATDFEWPRTVQANVSVQREIFKDLTVSVALVGSKASKLPFGRDVNYPVLTPTATAAGANILSRRPNPAFGAVLVLDSDQEASYKGLQFTANYRLGKLFTLNAFYTLSKTESSVQLHNNTTQGLAQNYSLLGEDRGRADTDQRHVFGASMNFRTEFYKGDNRIIKHIVNGWSISPIIKMRSGRPFSVTNGAVDANLDGNTNDRAQLIGDPHLANPSPAMWFNTAAFTRNLVVTGVAKDGDSPRNFLTGPSFGTLDMALSRDFRFSERYRLRIRAEGTNVLNTVNLDLPNAAAPAPGTTSTTFGVISGAGSMRKLQFGFRFTF